ncbi:MAG: hypothetical protein ACREA8_06675 [Nitrosotalea sp.]
MKIFRLPTCLGMIAVIALLSFALHSALGSEGRMIGVIDFVDSPSHFLGPTFSNFHYAGDIVKLHGYVLDVDDWRQSLGAKATVTVTGPDGSIVFSKENITTDSNNEFFIDIPITGDFKIGKYVTTVEPIKNGYQKLDNQYLAVFYVMRKNDFAFSQQGQDLPVIVSSLQFGASDMKFDNNRTLTFDIHRIPGNYTTDSDLGYPDNQIWVLIKKPLALGAFEQTADIPGMKGWIWWGQNDTYSLVQLGCNQVSQNATVILVGAGT